MLKYSKGHKISLNLTLVNNDGSPEENANVSYELYDDNYNILISNNDLPFNEQLGSYIDIISPETDWTNQQEGLYHIKWYISNTIEDYPDSVIEDLYIESYDDKLDRILGLVHENILINEPEYDKYGNLTRAKITLYSKSSSVGTDHDIIGKYKIESESEGLGKLIYWKQVEI